MVEQKIEKKLIDKFAAALSAANVAGVQIIGAWQSTNAAAADPKAIETAFARGYLSVKVSPRAYESFTMAEGLLSVKIELNVRSEVDACGVDCLTITNSLSSLIHSWQRSFSTGNTDFAIANEFDYTGFRIDGGDCGIDQANSTWTYQQNFTIQGIFLN